MSNPNANIKSASGIDYGFDKMNGFKRWKNPLLRIPPRSTNEKTNLQIKENLLLVNARQGQLCIITPKGDYIIKELKLRTDEANLCPRS